MKSYSPRNRLLLAVPARHLKALMEDFEFIRCQREQILLDADSSLDHIFFPESGVVSVVAVYADGNIIEMATIGREGCTGVQAVFGSKASSARLLVQIPGGAAKMSRAAFDRAMKSMPSFRGLMFWACSGPLSRTQSRVWRRRAWSSAGGSRSRSSSGRV
jgi:CRP-like cAMP-binding protein